MRNNVVRFADYQDRGDHVPSEPEPTQEIVVVDLRMPGLAGEAVLEVVRRTPVLQRIPVLIISGFLDDAPGVGEGLNIVGRLPKPLSLPRLIETVRDALGPTTGPGSWSTRREPTRCS
jgi:response regulator RpfG family c-di-GMP phosphodiesterase